MFGIDCRNCIYGRKDETGFLCTDPEEWRNEQGDLVCRYHRGAIVASSPSDYQKGAADQLKACEKAIADLQEVEMLGVVGLGKKTVLTALRASAICKR